MPPKVALVAYIVFLVWLLKIEREQNPEASLSLWIPTLFFMIMSSRPVGRWFSPGSSGGNAAEGSPLDRLVLNGLILIALFVLSKRKIKWAQVFKENRYLILFYLFLGLSIFWSGYPYSSFKRWFKMVGLAIMGFMVLSEYKPLHALESILRRSAYVLIPLSLVLIKYFPQYGISYTVHEGTRMGTGVTTHKNSLGVLCAVLVFFLIWRLFLKWRTGSFFKSKSHTLADVIVAGIGLFLLFGGGATYSATSIIIFLIGMTLLITLYRYKNLTKYLADHLKSVLIVMAVLFMLFYSILLPVVTSSLNRSENLTDRDQIWRSVLDIASHNPILGTGYGGYWGVAGDPYKQHLKVTQSHDGYIDIYLQVGIVGLVFFIVFIFEFCDNIRRAVSHQHDWGVFGMCFLIMVLIYNYSEASFISTSLIWTLIVFMSIVFSTPSLYAQETEDEKEPA